jgi:FkbM family methyltransferase
MSVDNVSEFHARILELNGGEWFHFEPHLAALYRAILRPGSVAVDGGANIGLHALQMAQAVRPNGLVVAIEPVMESRERLDSRRREEQIPGEVIRVLPYGLSNAAGEAEFFQVLDPIQHELSGLRNRDILTNHQVKRIHIELTTLDTLCRDLHRLDFLKLDLEGAEMDALRGGRRTLSRFRPVVALEQSQDSPVYFGYTWDDLLEYFASLQYEVYDLFGLRYTGAEMLDHCAVWDFVGLPAEYPNKDALFLAVRRSMQVKGVLPPDAGVSRQLNCSGVALACCLDSVGGVINPGADAFIHVADGRSIEIWGWAVDQQGMIPAGGVDIVIDNELYSAVYGEERRDVAEHLKSHACRDSGFCLTLRPGTLAQGRHVVSLRVVAHDQRSYYQGPQVALMVD